MSNELTTTNNNLSFEQMERSAEIIAQSKLFPQWDTKEKIMTLMLLCKAEGTDPLSAINRYDFINGRVAKKSQAMLEDFIKCGGKVEWKQSTNEVAEATFIPPNGKPLTLAVTMADMAKAGLNAKDNYRKYPAQMLRARLISNAMRMVFPSATNLLYVPEEVEDMEAPSVPSQPATAQFEKKCFINKTATQLVDTAEAKKTATEAIEVKADVVCEAKTIIEKIKELDQACVMTVICDKFKKRRIEDLTEAQLKSIELNWDKFVKLVKGEK